jgi:hypothetical protein
MTISKGNNDFDQNKMIQSPMDECSPRRRPTPVATSILRRFSAAKMKRAKVSDIGDSNGHDGNTIAAGESLEDMPTLSEDLISTTSSFCDERTLFKYVKVIRYTPDTATREKDCARNRHISLDAAFMKFKFFRHQNIHGVVFPPPITSLTGTGVVFLRSSVFRRSVLVLRSLSLIFSPTNVSTQDGTGQQDLQLGSIVVAKK